MFAKSFNIHMANQFFFNILLTVMLSSLFSLISFLAFIHQTVVVQDLENIWVNHSFDIQVWRKNSNRNLLRL